MVTKTELKATMTAEDFKIASELYEDSTGQIIGFTESLEFEILTPEEIKEYVSGRKEMDAYRANPYKEPCGFSVKSI
jgi:hypothetical protein